MKVKILQRREKYKKTKTAENKWLTNFNEHYAEFKIQVDLKEVDFTF